MAVKGTSDEMVAGARRRRATGDGVVAAEQDWVVVGEGMTLGRFLAVFMFSVAEVGRLGRTSWVSIDQVYQVEQVLGWVSEVVN